MVRAAKEQLERTALAGVYNTQPIVIVFGAVSMRNPVVLAPGEYEIQPTSTCFYIQGDSTVVATSNSIPLAQDQIKRVEVTGPTTGFFAVVQDMGPGNFCIVNPRGPAT